MLEGKSLYSRYYLEFHRSAEVPAIRSQTRGATRPKPYGAWAMKDVLPRGEATTSSSPVVEDKQLGFDSTRSTGCWDRFVC